MPSNEIEHLEREEEGIAKEIRDVESKRIALTQELHRVSQEKIKAQAKLGQEKILKQKQDLENLKKEQEEAQKKMMEDNKKKAA